MVCWKRTVQVLDPAKANPPALGTKQTMGEKLQKGSVMLPCRSGPGRLAGKFFSASSRYPTFDTSALHYGLQMSWVPFPRSVGRRLNMPTGLQNALIP